MAFNLTAIWGSRYQARVFFTLTVVVVIASVSVPLLIAIFAPNGKIWGELNSFATSIAAAALFSSMSALYFRFFFADPNEMAAQSYVFPKDIGWALETIAKTATEYKIFVRTGRHFRAKILPLLIDQARLNRSPIHLDIVLLDYRDAAVCERYASYRKASSFDSAVWTEFYVKSEVLATILAVAKATNENFGLIKVDLYLSRRLSTFRIEGSASQLMVTREDPNDAASRFNWGQPEFAAYLTEFSWIRDEAFHVRANSPGLLPATLPELFSEPGVPAELVDAATRALDTRSPYAR